MALGEAQSKCDHISGIPLQPDIQKHLHTLYLAKGVHATTAIEGNTLSVEEIQDRIEGKLDLPPSREYLGKEADNIIRGCNEIMDRVMQSGPADLDFEKIKEYNRIILEGLALAEEVVPGEIREHSVGVVRYRGAPPEDCEYLLTRMCEWLNGDIREQKKENLIAFGILRAIAAHIYIAWIHPFGDGNGRTARLVEFEILLANGVPTDAAHLLSNHYNQTRDEYYRQLDSASKSNGQIIPFIEYALQGFIDGLKEQIRVIREAQLQITWRDFIYDNFRNISGSTNERRRKLILDISEKTEPIPLKDIRHVSPRIAELYASKKDRTISRDINELISMELLERKGKGFFPKRERMLAFLPARRIEK
jgi:Fic family protein